ncbi:hypothetical protein XNC3_1450013 [Xenorhabdus nematophila F1]|nr:hypothetical protein XNC3_1450013 [Xenorhabdus nematophila F1]CEE94438.1 hypothetical protein XNA1_4640027 [Xenorhabdus nematophila str. Anatoliense]CEE95652.1 hypothetical protein XNA1_600027 [Xenorhabdus nematophila str. Anatoliense]
MVGLHQVDQIISGAVLRLFEAGNLGQCDFKMIFSFLSLKLWDFYAKRI